MVVYQVGAQLKEDVFGRIERIDCIDSTRDMPMPFAVRRVAVGSQVPGSRVIAHLLAQREARALDRLTGLASVPRLLTNDALAALPSLDGHVPEPQDVFLRTWLDGEPLHCTRTLPRDFFDRLDDVVAAMHARGICHNDLHKEPNVLVLSSGHPALVDFQLASMHASETRSFRIRSLEDLRHVEKHRGRYCRQSRGADEICEPSQGAGAGLSRSILAAAWRHSGKRMYNLVTRGLLRRSDGEARRPSGGPWPTWTAAVGRLPNAD